MAINAAGWARSIAVVALLGWLLSGCASSPPGNYSAGRGVGAYRVGVPYQIHGVWYYPVIDYNYDRTGVACGMASNSRDG
jgi:rare lipoprotein A